MNFAIKVRAETTGTAETTETTENIFDTLFRCGPFRLCGLCGLKKNLTKRETPISCQKGSGLASIKRKPGWDILCVFPIRALD